MGNTIPTLIALGFIAFLFLTQGTIFQQLKEKLIPLSSIIRGKVSTKFKFGAIYAVLEGIWKDEKVKVELKKVANWRHPGELFITFYNPRNWPFSVKIKPLRKNIFDTMKTPIGFFVSGCKFKMIEEEIEVVADIDDKIRIREFLNSERLKIIHDVFHRGFKVIEAGKDSMSRNYLKIGLEPPKDEVLEQTMMDEILQRLKEFCDNTQGIELFNETIMSGHEISNPC